ncbi:putative sulfate transporter-like protein [Emericellopsis cladophorae]|uniref:Sulfate transporter-like protein n=1 Tax=Emericellopsis cladophorae TaxID=2686198 RepID=A0A9P9XVT5_9HYPO|nr:putative sulfate transporter-like protein [Emericellopsis cladophorae]KAI6778365.1 putative sulfate transporter-like protein [Emericellopsis cladophorae]
MSFPPNNRASSYSAGDYRPSQPSTLRQSHRPSSRGPPSESTSNGPAASSDESSPLLDRSSDAPSGHDESCAHGTFSPRPESPAHGRTNSDGFSTPGSGTHIPALDDALTNIIGHDDWKHWLKKRIRTKKMGQSSELAAEAGIRDTPLMYMAYYVPCLNWLRQYKWSYLQGDLVSAITMASFYLPMALSYASNLAHVPPIHGLYAFVFNPFVYALFGSCPQMVVGPEAAGSLLVGTAIKASVDSGDGTEDNDVLHARICGVVTGMAGAMVLIAGLVRLGFLDSVLSRPFLRGFISAIGFVITVDQLIPELGLSDVADHVKVSHGSSADKVGFIIEHIKETHTATFLVAAVSFVIIMFFRELKKYLQPRLPSIVFIPDRFLVVVISTILCKQYRWDLQGIEILGNVKPPSGSPFTFRWPFQSAHMPHIRDGMSTSFLIALLGFFESSVAAKSLGAGTSTIQGMQLSANRELIALGVANLVGGSFLSLPAFGGYGRSKVNQQTGGKTPMSSILLSVVALLCVLFFLPYFYYLPKPVLSAMISVVAYSLMEEAPHDIGFFLRIRGWKELGLMALIFVSTVFYSLTMGMAIGVGVSLLMVIRHSTRPRIQIMGRIPGTNRFENAEAEDSRLESIEGCLIVKIPEPLTFANTGELKSRLRRLEMYGTSSAHPALPRLRSTDMNRNVIFDIHGVTSIDGSGMQVLTEIVTNYRERGARVFFSRGPTKRHGNAIWRMMQGSGIVDMCGGEGHFVDDVDEALRRTEYEESVHE